MTNDPRIPRSPDDAASEALLDAAVAAARTGPPADAVASSRDNVAAMLRAAGLAVGEDDCEAFRRDLPALVDSTLAPDRADLVADHCRECLPCRKALLVLRQGAPVPATAPAAAARRPGRVGRVLAPLAVLAAAIGAVALAVSFLRPAPSPLMSRLVTIDGQILDDEGSALAPGALIPTGRPVRTARASRAVIELPDGSRLEMNERASLSVESADESLTVDLDRGDVIVEAAPRKQRNLFVRTSDCTVAVKGTVFTVRRGLKGSRVGVLEGSVHVEQDGQLSVLAQGDQVATDPALTPEALDEQVAWSVDRERYTALLDVIRSAAEQLEQEGFERAPRHESTILDAMPESAVLYAAMPNDGEMARLAELIGQRVATNPRLSKWWDAQLREDTAQPNFAVMLDTLQRLSAALGEEVVLTLVDGTGAEPMPVLIASVRDEAGLRSLIEDLAARSGHEAPELLSSHTLPTLGRDGELNLLLHAGHVLAGPRPAALSQFVSGFDEPRPRSSRFLASLDGQYDRGAEYLVAADLSRIVAGATRAHAATAGGGWVDRSMDVLGLSAADQFVLTAGHDDPGTAVLSFNERRTGLASWLAEPSPLGGLSFVTPQAGVVFAAACREPQGMLLDLQRISGSDANGAFAQFREKTGVDLVELAGTLGGEMALALDGPVLPKPSWKLVLEVYDEVRLQETLERLVDEAAARQREVAPDAAAPALTPIETSEGGAWQLDLGVLRIAYAYRDGYLVACPAVPLLEGALQAKRLDVNVAQSPRFRDLLPGGIESDVSLLLYQDLASTFGDLQQASAMLPAGAREALGGAGPSLAFARAAETSISFGLMAPEGGLGRGLASFVRQHALQALARESLVEAPRDAIDADR